MTRLFELTRQYRVLSLIGLGKNVGKTTALAALIRAQAEEGRVLGLSSVGRDGERSDLVTGTKKPPLFVREGTLFATASGALADCDCTKELLKATNITTPLGEVLVCRARSSGYVLLAGPSTTQGLRLIGEQLTALGAERIYLDGALFRRAPADPRVSDACVLATGAAYARDPAKIVCDTLAAAELIALPATNDFPLGKDATRFRAKRGAQTLPAQTLSDALEQGVDAILLGGAVTEERLRPLLTGTGEAEGLRLTAEDCCRILLGAEAQVRLKRRGVKLFVQRPATLAAITVSPFDPRGNSLDVRLLMDAIKKRSPVPVLDVLADEAAQDEA